MPCVVCEHLGCRGGEHSRDDDCLVGEKQLAKHTAYMAELEQRKARENAGKSNHQQLPPNSGPEKRTPVSGEAERKGEP